MHREVSLFILSVPTHCRPIRSPTKTEEIICISGDYSAWQKGSWHPLAKMDTYKSYGETFQSTENTFKKLIKTI